MSRSLWMRVWAVAVLVGGALLAGGPAVAAGSAPAYTCTGGDVPSNTYSSLTIAGVCQVPQDGSGVIHVLGNLAVAPGAVFDAQSAPSTITVGHNVTAGAGSLMGLGCQPSGVHAKHDCKYEPEQSAVITVAGNVTATDANLVLLNGITVNGNVTLTGGGAGGAGGSDWAIKNNVIGGNVTASDITPDWFGLLFNHIGGNASLTNITALDPDDEGFGAAVNVVVNTIGRNLNCSGLGPRLSGGFIPGAVNIVGGRSTGQCVGLVGGS